MSSESEKRHAILEAATRLFGRYGYRRTSIDLIATEAEVAKGTIYSWFEHKEALFRAVCAHVCAVFLEQAQLAASSDLPFKERLLAVLQAHYGYVYEVVQSSAHAAELFDSKHRLGSDIVAEAMMEYRNVLTTLLLTAEAEGRIVIARVAESPQVLTDVILHCAQGATLDATSSEQQRKQLAQVVRLIAVSLQASPVSDS